MAEELERSSSSSSEASGSGPSTPPTSLSPSPVPCEVVFPSPFIPATVEDKDRQCPPLPKGFPAVPWNDTPKVVDKNDARTPDGWVKRHPELLRLTGKHPFNCEARLAPLFDAGFITPAHLHVVRNHGAVPNVDESKARDWRIRVHGLVEREVSFSLEDLKHLFPVVTFPVTICCAGNRRREQNMFRKTLGFSWGSAGVSTALWTGVYLADILDYVKPRRRSAKHVVFEGADDLPQGPYGTSQLLSRARNKENGMLIAWAMNGLPLEPDHGYPVRVVIPGQIGGRMVKWLTRIEVSERESQHYLHFKDNKVLPTELTPERARVEDHWWYDPRYIITELNVNSVIAKPDHNEILHIPSHPREDDTSVYNVRGFAYAGGGRRIGRVEVSLNDGANWELAHVDYPEDLFRHVVHDDPIYGTIDLTERDTCFCWCFWTYPVPISRLAETSVITVRAMDEGMNIQPRNMYPNATGMLNNWWFRVAVLQSEVADGLQLRFEHPAPVETSGGWMERMKSDGKDVISPTFNLPSRSTPAEGSAEHQVVAPTKDILMINPDVKRQITAEEMKAQDPQKPWFVVKGEVYDGTDYLKDHPGGADSILIVAGDDATDDFMSIHSSDAKQKLAQFHIGTLTSSLTSFSHDVSAASSNNAPDLTKPFLSPKTWKFITLTSIERVNHDSLIYTFSFPSAPDQPLGLPVGQHVFVRLRRKDTGEMVQRAYTPVSRVGAKGGIELLIKLYLPSAAFPSGGKMTTGFHRLEVGDTIEMKGPLGSFVWHGQGVAVWKGVTRSVKEIGLVCGGSGITPILQVIRAVLHDPDDIITRLSLLYANKTELDILCRNELETLLTLHQSGRLRIHYVLSSSPLTNSSLDVSQSTTDQQQPRFSQGRVTDALLRTWMPEPSKDALVLVCGPEGMISQTISPGLKRIGWDIETSLVVF